LSSSFFSCILCLFFPSTLGFWFCFVLFWLLVLGSLVQFWSWEELRDRSRDFLCVFVCARAFLFSENWLWRPRTEQGSWWRRTGSRGSGKFGFGFGV
jgi:hypothetical protein